LRTLMEMGSDVQELLPPILNALKDSHYYVRSAVREALRTLVEKGADVQAMVPPILNALKDSDYSVRRAALEALRTLMEMGADVQELLPPILNALKDSDYYVRSAVREALRTLVEKGADVQAMVTPILNALQHSNSDVRRAALQSLPPLVEKGADVQVLVTPILNALKDSDYSVHSDAIEVLPTLVEKGVDVQEVLPHIFKYLRYNNPVVHRTAIEALLSILLRKDTDVNLVAITDTCVYDTNRFLQTLVEKAAYEEVLPLLMNFLGDRRNALHRSIMKAIDQYSTELLVNYYWEHQKEKAACCMLAHRALTEVGFVIDNDRWGNQKLILYDTAVKTWSKSKREIQKFKRIASNSEYYLKWLYAPDLIAGHTSGAIATLGYAQFVLPCFGVYIWEEMETAKDLTWYYFFCVSCVSSPLAYYYIMVHFRSSVTFVRYLSLITLVPSLLTLVLAIEMMSPWNTVCTLVACNTIVRTFYICMFISGILMTLISYFTTTLLKNY
ncbi:MAG: HEAT repeat domain-containing protein, partial [Bacteroidota bacterium]